MQLRTCDLIGDHRQVQRDKEVEPSFMGLGGNVVNKGPIGGSWVLECIVASHWLGCCLGRRVGNSSLWEMQSRSLSIWCNKL